MEIKRVCEYEGSSVWGMNGGQPESPDGKWLVYGRKPDLTDKEKQETQIWICDRETLGDARHLFTVRCGNHNGPSATFVDNEHTVTHSTYFGKDMRADKKRLFLAEL